LFSQKAHRYLRVFFALPSTIHSAETLRYIVLTINLLRESAPETYDNVFVQKIGEKGIETLFTLIKK
jgi:hypothetical protein